MLTQDQDKNSTNPTKPGEPVKINLDQYPLGQLKLPSLKSLKDDPKSNVPLFSTVSESSLELKLNREQLNIKQDAPNVAIIDILTEIKQVQTIHSETEDVKINVEGTHLGAVARAIASKGLNIVKIFDVTDAEKKGFSSKKMSQSLDELILFSKETPVHALNISLANHVSFKKLNENLKAHSLLPEGVTEVNNSNIAECSEAIKELVKKEAANSVEMSLVLEISEKLQKLSDSGTAVCIGAGNNTKDGFNLFAALVPDLLVIGGSVGITAKVTEYDKDSSQSSLNDSVQPFRFTFNLNGSGGVTVEGTSFSTPQALCEVAALRKEGLSVVEINQLLRTRLEESHLEKSNNIVTRDFLAAISSLSNIEKILGKDPNIVVDVKLLRQIGVLSKSELNMIDAYKEASELKAAEVSVIAELLVTKTNANVIPRDIFQDLLKAYSALDPKEQSEFVEKVKLVPKKIKLELFRSMISEA